jgi:hypothetical protein
MSRVSSKPQNLKQHGLSQFNSLNYITSPLRNKNHFEGEKTGLTRASLFMT